jgi:hypothetical protein
MLRGERDLNNSSIRGSSEGLSGLMYIGLPVLVKADVVAWFGYLSFIMFLLLETSQTRGVQQ